MSKKKEEGGTMGKFTLQKGDWLLVDSDESEEQQRFIDEEDEDVLDEENEEDEADEED